MQGRGCSIFSPCFFCNTHSCSASFYCLPKACVYTGNFRKYKLPLKRVKNGYFTSPCSCSADCSTFHFVLFYKPHCSHFPSVPWWKWMANAIQSGGVQARRISVCSKPPSSLFLDLETELVWRPHQHTSLTPYEAAWSRWLWVHLGNGRYVWKCAHSSETGPAAASLRRKRALTLQLPLICRPERLCSNFSCLHYFCCVCQPNREKPATSPLWGLSAALPQSLEKLAILKLMEGLQRATNIIPPSNPSGPDAVLVTTFTWQSQTIQRRIMVMEVGERRAMIESLSWKDWFPNHGVKGKMKHFLLMSFEVISSLLWVLLYIWVRKWTHLFIRKPYFAARLGQCSAVGCCGLSLLLFPCWELWC